MRLLLIGLLLATSAMADDEWREDYTYALQSLERNQLAATIDALGKAIAKRPQPLLSESPSEADYLPYLHLAIVHFEAGNLDAARQALELSDLKGAAEKSHLGNRLRDRYALPIMATDNAVIADAETSYREFERQAFTLSEAEAKVIRGQVLRRCALASDAKDDLPWYFHYEYGVELMEAGDSQRALDALILAATHREESKRQSRMYGMWFTDYLPYYQIAQAHSKLGNWRCAIDAMRISARYGEYSPVDAGFQEYSDLQKLVMRQNEEGGS
jgi:tetratricopeptide (TPR) repeat protein